MKITSDVEPGLTVDVILDTIVVGTEPPGTVDIMDFVTTVTAGGMIDVTVTVLTAGGGSRIVEVTVER